MVTQNKQSTIKYKRGKLSLARENLDSFKTQFVLSGTA